MRGEKAQKSKDTQKGIETENGKKVVRNKYLNFQNNSPNILISSLLVYNPWGHLAKQSLTKKGKDFVSQSSPLSLYFSLVFSLSTLSLPPLPLSLFSLYLFHPFKDHKI